MNRFKYFVLVLITMCACENEVAKQQPKTYDEIKIDYVLTKDKFHSKFSQKFEPVLTVDPGSIIEISTEEATSGQLSIDSDTSDLMNLSFDPIHPLTGPIFIKGAKPGDVISVKLHRIEIGDWGWTAILPGFGFLADQFTTPKLRTWELAGKNEIKFNDDIRIPLNPFPGVLGVAPPTDSLLSTIPPRANGGNMDDPNIIQGTTVYLPVFVDGALFSIGDAHAAQGMGEVCGTAIEAPMKFIVELDLVKNKSIQEPQYERDDIYAVTAFGNSIDEAARKATNYMIDYLVTDHDLSRDDAYMLCSLAGDLKIAETVDMPHYLVSMHIEKKVLGL